MNDATRLRLMTLLNALEEGVLDEAHRAELVEILKASDEAQTLYLHFRALSADLGDYAREGVLSTNDEPIETLPPIHIDAQALTKQQYVDALTYVLKHTFTPKRLALLATAAVLLVGMVLTIVLMTGPESQTITDNTPQPTKPAESAQPIPRDQTPTPVATLTAQHNAQWTGRPASAGTEHPLKTGSKLHPGTRLTLTHGFAEITTARGAIAIIEAPATFELLDSDNAIRLHTGKLVGICETESSKGFVVHTPHLDITDLGTRFGVDAAELDVTQVHVYLGEVQVNRSSERGLTQQTPEHVAAGQGLRYAHNSESFEVIAANPTRFAAMRHAGCLPESTGYGLQIGDADPNWRVVAIDGQPITEGNTMSVVYAGFGDPATSQWLLVYKDILPDKHSERTITCATSFALPAGLDTDTAQLILGFSADLKVVGIRVNGQPVQVPDNKLDRDAPLTEVAIHQLTRPGQNTIEIDVFDKDAHTALRAALEIRPNTP